MYKGFRHVELNNREYDFVAVKYSVYSREEDGEYIALAAWVDMNSKQALDVTVTHIDNNNDISLVFQSTNSTTSNPGVITTDDFQFNGQSFVCSMTGLFACISYCGIWHLVNPGEGLTCDILCGGAFAFACSGA
ncbi:putative immunity/bacteriocin fusion bifunctional protein [Paenibacillus tarimensis]|uniref:putative immunity/bacteriocin fusion bifunctional protein n=1 Tax=Paenibacillus tarimensis TaxID=416012 RepID=UPI001EEA11E0|nr:putative immunity/bacteriocin fusion bifunctional protein [Paenibacillus tarimensis]MCF2945229.1 hypothetical protein [Paenibacillus tarimensis]